MFYLILDTFRIKLLDKTQAQPDIISNRKLGSPLGLFNSIKPVFFRSRTFLGSRAIYHVAFFNMRDPTTII